MNLLQMRYFVSVADNMSFTRASQALYVSQPSISKQVASLEDELGLKLFYRSGKSIALTVAGELLYYDFKNLLKNLDELVQRAQDIGNAILGELKVGVFQSMDISKVAPDLIKTFVSENPNIRLLLRFERYKELQQLLLDGDLDCAFLLPFEAAELMHCVQLMTFETPKAPHRLIFPRSIVPDDTEPVLTDFINETFIFVASPDGEDVLNKTALGVTVNAGIEPRQIIWVDSIDSLMLCVKEGMGVGVAGPTARVEYAPNVRYIMLPGERSNVGVNLCWKPSNNNPSLPVFVDLLKRLIASETGTSLK